MEAVPAASGARRTVRLATALVVGQVLLVAVIGWVTFSYAGKHPAGSRPAIDQLAAPPAAIPPAPVPGHSATSAPAATKSPEGTGSRERTGDPVLPAATRPRSSSRPAVGPVATGTSVTPGAPVVPPAPPATTPSSGSPATPPLTLVPTSDAPAVSTPAPTASSTPPPVLAGQACPRIFARARDVDGWMVRCLPTREHRLIWKIV